MYLCNNKKYILIVGEIIHWKRFPTEFACSWNCSKLDISEKPILANSSLTERSSIVFAMLYVTKTTHSDNLSMLHLVLEFLSEWILPFFVCGHATDITYVTCLQQLLVRKNHRHIFLYIGAILHCGKNRRVFQHCLFKYPFSLGVGGRCSCGKCFWFDSASKHLVLRFPSSSFRNLPCNLYHG